MSRLPHKLSVRLGLGILLMATPVFVLSLGALYLQSRHFIHKEAMEHANSELDTKLQRVRIFMSTVETATNASAWLAEESFKPDSLFSGSHRAKERHQAYSALSIAHRWDGVTVFIKGNAFHIDFAGCCGTVVLCYHYSCVVAGIFINDKDILNYLDILRCNAAPA